MKYPKRCKYFGCIGNDIQAEEFDSILKKEDVRSFAYKNKTYPTGICASVIYDKERSLVANLGASLHFPNDHLENYC